MSPTSTEIFVDSIPLPKYIDDPITLLIWSADEFVPFSAVLLIGMLMGQLTMALIFSALVIKAYRRFRDNRPDGFPLHVAYWWGLLPSSAISVPNPYIRKFFP
jgi:conjugal transfer pilus assembly protein TraL